MGPDNILRWCVLEEEIPRVLKEAYEGPTRGHMGPDTTPFLFLRPTLSATSCLVPAGLHMAHILGFG